MSEAESSHLTVDVTTPICKRGCPCSLASVIVLKVFLNFIPPRVRFIKKQSIIHLSPCFQTRNVYWISEGRRAKGAHRHLIKCLVSMRSQTKSRHKNVTISLCVFLPCEKMACLEAVCLFP